MKIALLGAAGGIGQALGLLLKTQLPSGSESVSYTHLTLPTKA